MSNGPIQRERDAWKPLEVSTSDRARVCFDVKGRGYCGRSSSKERMSVWSKVSCADCLAAARADEVEVA